MFGLPPLPRHLDAALTDVVSPKESVRHSALADLARHADGDARPQVIAALVTALCRDPSPANRALAAIALADAHAEEALAQILGAAEDPDLRVRQHVLMALGELGRPDTPGLTECVQAASSSEYAALRYQALVASQRLLGAGAQGALAQGLSDQDAEVRWVALRLLEETITGAGGRDGIQDETVEKVCRALDDPHPPLRRLAAIVLCLMREPRGYSALVQALQSGRGWEPEDERLAVELAGTLSLRDAIATLRRRARLGFAEGSCGWAATVALARMGDPRARHAIVKELESWSLARRGRALVLVGELGWREAAPTLRKVQKAPRGLDPERIDATLRAIEMNRSVAGNREC